MPSEQSTSTPALPADLDLVSQQVKVCSRCRAPVPQDVDYTNPLLFMHNSDLDPSSLCAVCRDRSSTTRQSVASAVRGIPFSQVDFDPARRSSIQEPSDDSCIGLTLPPAQPHAPQLDSVEQQCSQPSSTVPLDPTYSPRSQSILESVHHVLKVKIQTDSNTLHHHPRSSATESSAVVSLSSPLSSFSCKCPSYSPDPLVDITRLRVRSTTHHCLYPGATFSGTQKSGRNSYDVNVTIVVSSRSPYIIQI
jgi:glucose-induced degradation protein 4